MLFSATPDYHPVMRIFDHKPRDPKGGDSGENIEIRPIISKDNKQAMYQLCYGKTYILEVGISTSSKFYSKNKGEFWAYFSNSPLRAYQHLTKREFHPQGGTNILKSYNIHLRAQGIFEEVINTTQGGEKVIGVWDPDMVPYVNAAKAEVDFFFPGPTSRNGNDRPSTLGVLRVHFMLPSEYLQNQVKAMQPNRENTQVTIAHVADSGVHKIIGLLNNTVNVD
jgi:hypothetical protein